MSATLYNKDTHYYTNHRNHQTSDDRITVSNSID